MAVLFVLFAVPVWSCCNAEAAFRHRAKVVEDYVLSAKFNENKNLPQINEKSRSREIYRDDETKGASDFSRHRQGDDFEDGDGLEERDLLVHHHHLPPHPPPPPPPPPPPVGLAYAPSLFAVGLITFLILLNSLQTSLLLMLKTKNSLLGTVTGALGRRKRSVEIDVDGFRKKYEKSNLNTERRWS